MKKVRKYWLSPDKNVLCFSLVINNTSCGFAAREVVYPFRIWDHLSLSDITLHDLELHAFMRVSHSFIVNPSSVSGEKIEEMFEIDNPNI